MITKIILVGCGNIGSRHLQAIAKLPFEIKVDIVESNDDAQILEKTRLNKIPYDKSTHKFFWHKSINELTNVAEIIIIATNSVGMVKLLSELINK